MFSDKKLSPYIKKHIYELDEIQSLLNEAIILIRTNVQLCEEIINAWTVFQEAELQKSQKGFYAKWMVRVRSKVSSASENIELLKTFLQGFVRKA